jgi:lipoprotein signal peptidase
MFVLAPFAYFGIRRFFSKRNWLATDLAIALLVGGLIGLIIASSIQPFLNMFMQVTIGPDFFKYYNPADFIC